MKKLNGILAVTLGSVMALSLLAGCGGKVSNDPVAARICYDNLPDDGISIAVEDTQYTLPNATLTSATDAKGNAVDDPTTIATYDEATGVVTAVSAGTVTFTLKGEKKFRIEVVPAYATNPKYQYANSAADYSQDGRLLGGTHDPSLIEVEEDGKPAYYIFSTGWGLGNEIRKSYDLIRWEYLGKATKAETSIPEIEKWLESENDGTHISWWAPDIVENPEGGYWLYTCAVSAGRTEAEGYREIDGTLYSKACIVLFSSKTLEPGSFRYKGVLMQSCIPKGALGAIDVNSIDPQIIYDTNGKMYMAYGSFGTGNWMLELNPKTGLRKDGLYKNGKFLDWQTVRANRDEAVELYSSFKDGEDVETDYYGKMISQANMEAPVIARHDNVTVSDENGTVTAEGKTFYYSMHSYNGLDIAYQMWGGRSESVWGRYTSVNGASVYNNNRGNASNTGNKYMGSFTWTTKASNVFEPNIVLPGHNDLFTTKDGVNVAAYITRTASYNTDGRVFMSQIHQYYLNSFGDICINPNRYGGEISRTVTADDLFAYTDGGRFQMVALENGDHAENNATASVDVTLTRNGTDSNGNVKYGDTVIGTWQMYGKGYIKFTFNEARTAIQSLANAGETVYYGVVRPSWLNDQNKSGFTITTLGHSGSMRSMAMFMNAYTTISL